jgi:hypothetical protein
MLEKFIKLFMMTDPTLNVKFYPHFLAAVLCPIWQERAVELPKGWNAVNVPRPSLALETAAQQEEDGRWDSRDLKADRALQTEMKRLSTLRANKTPEQVEKVWAKQRVVNLKPEQAEKNRAKQRVVNMEPEQAEKKRAYHCVVNLKPEPKACEKASNLVANLSDSRLKRKRESCKESARKSRDKKRKLT